jgi:hypothetical protein
MPNATVRANAQTLPKSRPSPRRKTKAPLRAKKRAAPRRPEPNDPVGRLSFVASRDGLRLPLATKDPNGRCFWHVKPTGDGWEDCATGEKLALEYLEYEAKHWNRVGGSLQHIVMDMPRKLTGIEIGFLSTVAYAAAAGIQRARELVAQYDRDRAKRALALRRARPRKSAGRSPLVAEPNPQRRNTR